VAAVPGGLSLTPFTIIIIKKHLRIYTLSQHTSNPQEKAYVNDTSNASHCAFLKVMVAALLKELSNCDILLKVKRLKNKYIYIYLPMS
jgi:hypothetical protein